MRVQPRIAEGVIQPADPRSLQIRSIRIRVSRSLVSLAISESLTYMRSLDADPRHACFRFGSQEPLDDEGVASFCVKNHGVSFPLMVSRLRTTIEP